MNNRSDKKVIGKIVMTAGMVLSAFFVLLGFSVIWCMRTWKHLKMEELVYELSAPLEGTGSDMIIKYVVNSVVPMVVIMAVVIAAAVVIHRKKTDGKALRKLAIGLFAGSLAFLIACISVFWVRLDITDYLQNMGDDSKFIEQNYVDASKVNLTFPEKKRNLIYIYLESMESTYTDKENGGGFEKGCIPELTQLSEQNENFSADGKLNGGVVLPGTSWTMAGLFAQTSGLPLKIEIGENMMSTQENFFPGIRSLGDILKDEGYRQVFALGSNIEFGGRKVYFEKHGDYTFHDYYYAKNNGLIPDNYYVNWGFEDEKLFDIAKNDLTELAKSDEPFSYTMLTVDTHFEDGYVCRLCKDEFEGNQYANVMACSSRQVTEFVEWIKQQDFYENTTVILSGDHTTMDSDFCDDVSDDYLRKTYVAVLNPAVGKTRATENILYTTMDMFPTTLAALGVEIEGDQLGLGVNLFSDKQTIIERYGIDMVTAEFRKGSSFMNALSGITINASLRRKQGWAPDADIDVIAYDEETGILTVEAKDIVNLDDKPKLYATLYDMNEKKIKKYRMTLQPDRSYTCDISLKKLADRRGIIIVTAKDSGGTTKLGTLKGSLEYKAHEDVLEYIDLLKKKDNIAILMGMKTEAIKRTRSEIFDALKELGVGLELKGNKGCSFYAVIEGDSVKEELSTEAVSIEGTFEADGEPYSISSAAELVGDECQIIVEGKNRATNKRGLNIVVYDTQLHTVVDIVTFDISPRFNKHPVCTVNAALKNGTATLSLTKLKSAGDISRDSARIEIWDGEHPDEIIKSDLSLHGDESFSGDVDVSGIDTTDCYVRVYITNGKSLVEKMSCKWHGNLEELVDFRYVRY